LIGFITNAIANINTSDIILPICVLRYDGTLSIGKPE
jgi:hypothetical protein